MLTSCQVAENGFVENVCICKNLSETFLIRFKNLSNLILTLAIFQVLFVLFSYNKLNHYIIKSDMRQICMMHQFCTASQVELLLCMDDFCETENNY